MDIAGLVLNERAEEQFDTDRLVGELVTLEPPYLGNAGDFHDALDGDACVLRIVRALFRQSEKLPLLFIFGVFDVAVELADGFVEALLELLVGANAEPEPFELPLEIVPVNNEFDPAGFAGNFARGSFVFEKFAFDVFDELLETLLLAEPHHFLGHITPPVALRIVGSGVRVTKGQKRRVV